jgi:uncharacterized protein (TIGR02679 family)
VVTRDPLLEEAILYFRSNKGFCRMLDRMKSKYKSLGTVGGTIELRDLQPEEREALTGFLRKDYMRKKSAVIKMEHVQKALENTRFRGLLLEDILKGYFGEKLLSNKETRERYLKEREKFFNHIISSYQGTIAGEWLEYTWRTKDNAYQIFSQRYDTDKERLMEDIHSVCRGLLHLPVLTGKRLRLPVFVSNITANPHAFDENTSCGQILLHALAYQFGVSKPANAEGKAELYYAAGILFDEVSNYVLCNGLMAYTNNALHPGWDGFYRCKESLQVSLANLSSVDKVLSPDGKVFVFENAGVFAAVLDRLSNQHPPMVCTNGNVKIAALVLLDMLAKEGTTIYYSGDFDPEGLGIADKLKLRYGERLILWRYDIQDYEKAISNESIREARLKKMDHLKTPELVSLSKHIRQSSFSGYQELILEDLIKDMVKG